MRAAAAAVSANRLESAKTVSVRPVPKPARKTRLKFKLILKYYYHGFKLGSYLTNIYIEILIWKNKKIVRELYLLMLFKLQSASKIN